MHKCVYNTFRGTMTVLKFYFNSLVALEKNGFKFGFTVVYFSIIYMTTVTAQGNVILTILGQKIFFIKNPQKDMI